MKIKFTTYSTLAVALMLSTIVQAQQQSQSIIEQELEVKLLQWNRSQNAAGLLLDKPSQNSNLEAGYSGQNGNFTQPQVGQKSGDVFLKTKGNLYLKDYYLQGYFSYNRNNIKDAVYNASLIDPLRNMPYKVADTNASKWVNQHYVIGFKMATKPLAEKLALGLSGNYKASSGAKQRDIRAKNNYYELDVAPSIVYSISDRHHLGSNFLYKNYKEESNNSNVNTYVDQNYFFLFGLGNAINYVGSGRTMNYVADALGGGLQYQYNGNVKLLATANYTLQAEDANISFTNSRPVGTILMKKWDFDLNLQKRSEQFTHLANVDFTSSKSNGIEYITQFQSGTESDGYYVKYKSTRSKYNNTKSKIKYELIRNQGNAFSWKAAAFVSYDKLDNKYLIQPSNMLTENLFLGASFDKLFLLSGARNSQLVVGGKLTFKNNLDGAYNYSGSDANSVTVTELERRNFEYFTSNYSDIEIPLTYSQQLREGSSSELFIKASGQILSTSNFNFDNRKSFLVSIGVTF